MLQNLSLKAGEVLLWPLDRFTRFEVARLIGARALQISLGAPILVKTEEKDPIKIARLEFKQKLIPMTIKRRLPNGEEVFVNVKAAIENWLRDFGEP
jgi:DNA-directed RNA polymerase subunit K/omega